MLNRIEETISGYVDDFGDVPTSMEFQKYGKISARSITERLGMSFIEMLEYFGYEKNTNSKEK